MDPDSIVAIKNENKKKITAELYLSQLIKLTDNYHISACLASVVWFAELV